MNKLRIVFLLMFLCVLSNLTARITFGLTDSDGQKLSKLSQTVNIHSFDADDDKSAEAYADVINMDGEEVELAAAFKKVSQGNPLLSNHFCADPTAIEYEGRLYVYGTNDQQEFEVTKGKSNNTYGKINQLVCMSTDDMVNWTYHGVINVKAIAPWIWTSWAPSIVSKKQSDGKTHFYLYFTNSAAGIGVLTSTSPTGPWRDPLGRALIDGRTPGLGEMSNIIDPGVAISDDESEAYLTFGGGDVTTQAVFSLRGKPLNSFGLTKKVVYENEEFNLLQSALDIEDGLDTLRYNKVIVATDADVDGMHIRLLIITFFLQFFPELIKKGHVYVLQTPLFRVRNKRTKIRNKQVIADADARLSKADKKSDFITRYCYSEEERVKAINDLGTDPEITRFKGLGAISPDEFVHFIGPDMRLEQVTLHKTDQVQKLLEYYMGKNTIERQNFIIDNLVIEEDIPDEEEEIAS